MKQHTLTEEHLYDLGDYDNASVDFDKSIEIEPTYELAIYYRGLVYIKQGDYKRAIAEFSRSIMLVPQDARTYDRRGFRTRN